MQGEARTLSGLNILAGIWLIISPFILSYQSTGNEWQQVVLGIIVSILGIVRMSAADVAWPSWVNALIGLWMIVAPWVIPNTSTAARWNQVILGIIIAVFAYSSGATTVSHHTHATQH